MKRLSWLLGLHIGLAAFFATARSSGLRATAEGASYDGVSAARGSADLHQEQPRVLLFWSVGARDEVIDLVVRNVRHARQFLGSVKVYLAHYDLKKHYWRERAGSQWYSRNVDFSAEAPGYKFQLMMNLLVGTTFHLKAYDWVWALDEDIDFTVTPLPRMLQLADESQSVITLPAFTQGGKMSYPFQRPHPECAYRYVPMVEAIFPLLRPQVLAVLADCDHCMHEHSVWGMCKVWCAWSAKRLGKQPDTACAVLDETAVIHRNFKTLRGKYSGNSGSHGNRDMELRFENARWMEQANMDMHDVKEHHLQEFVAHKVTKKNWICAQSKHNNSQLSF